MKSPVCRMLLFVLAVVMLAGCSGEDRSDEMPRVPEGVVCTAAASGDSCRLTGVVGESHNSGLLSCGFYWGNDTLSNEIEMDSASYAFSAVVDSLQAGSYYAVSYATNGMGTTLSDTVYFRITNNK